MNVLNNESVAFSDSRQLALHSQNDISLAYPGLDNEDKDVEEKKVVASSRVDRVLAEFGLPLSRQVDAETKRSMRSCRERGYEKGRSILAGVGREILESQR